MLGHALHALSGEKAKAHFVTSHQQPSTCDIFTQMEVQVDGKSVGYSLHMKPSMNRVSFEGCIRKLLGLWDQNRHHSFSCYSYLD